MQPAAAFTYMDLVLRYVASFLYFCVSMERFCVFVSSSENNLNQFICAARFVRYLIGRCRAAARHRCSAPLCAARPAAGCWWRSCCGATASRWRPSSPSGCSCRTRWRCTAASRCWPACRTVRGTLARCLRGTSTPAASSSSARTAPSNKRHALSSSCKKIKFRSLAKHETRAYWKR